MGTDEDAEDGEALRFVDFWVSAGPDRWFVKSDEFDEACRAHLPLYERAAEGELDRWQLTAAGSLALVLLLDQVPRNVLRGTPQQFDTDHEALAVAEAAIGREHHLSQAWPVRNFYLLPYQHSEDLAVQERGLDLYLASAPQEFAYYALVHHDAIRRFGRFPHRNAVLGRETTAAETAYLEGGGFTG
ncbi:DUF924 family protein [Acuticoccus sp.]|uniref:DUF924 family protein n=1 Tax=Acuticoccus sp. TaxID=1904378 RepID=UPI003B5220CF